MTAASAKSAKIPNIEKTKALAPFDRVFVLFNPAGTHANRSARRIAELKKLYPGPGKVEVVETSPDGREANLTLIRKLSKRLNSRTLIGIAAGDGTVNLVVEALTATGKHSLSQAARQAPILPLWGGNANDLAYMLNGLSFGQSLKTVLTQAEIVPIYPIGCTIRHEAIVSQHVAACYIAFGISGRMAHTLNEKSYRSNSAWKGLGFKLFRELAYVAQTFRLATKFSYTQSHKRHYVYELLFANGSRMAKVDRLPIALSDPFFYVDHLEHSTLSAILRKLFNVARGRRRERRLHKRLAFTIHGQVWAQFDGEPEQVEAGSKVTINLHDQPFYALASSLRPPGDARRPSRLRLFARKHKLAIRVAVICLAIFIAFHAYLSLTNPYAKLSVVQQPYTTMLSKDGNIKITKKFDLQVHDNPAAQLLGYYKSGFLIAQNTLFGGKAVPGDSANQIIGNIHNTRFDPSKPYLISGDQFSVLYIRNLGVFYHSLLNPNTALDKEDWGKRQQIYLQASLYALDGLAKSSSIKTTVVPVGPRSVAMTAVHPGTTGSDTVYGLLYALNQLSTPTASQDGAYKLQTVQATRQIIRERHSDLKAIYQRYLAAVRDSTGNGDYVKAEVNLASARDGANRSQSFYDSMVLWKTRQLAQQLGLSDESTASIESSRQRLIAAYWSSKTGCFRDELAKPGSYSSDWLLAPPAGFLNYDRDYDMLASCVDYIRKQGLTKPLPIRYTNDETSEPWAVRTFAPSYGSTAIWSYWGAEYITMLAELHAIRPDVTMRDEALQDIKKWDQAIVVNHGYPETLDANGDFLRTPLYKSIRNTGWVVQFEYAKWLLEKEPSEFRNS